MDNQATKKCEVRGCEKVATVRNGNGEIYAGYYRLCDSHGALALAKRRAARKAARAVKAANLS
jgi:hypothetical protein